jgi:signal transduction histidine kinase
MDIYSQKSRWKIYLAAAGIVIVIISIFYSTFLAEKLREQEQKSATLFVQAQERITDEEYRGDLTTELAIIEANGEENGTIPVMWVNENNEIVDAVNFGPPEQWEKALQRMIQDGIEPIESNGQFLYYKESNLLKQLRYFPIIQLILIAAFILLGYVGFNSARRAEQNRVWVGMAKETAHQLGTPISAIMAWVEHLRLIREEDEEVQMVVNELEKDVDRLGLIADRFSKIGSAPKLEPVDVYEELDKCLQYMQKRAPRKVNFVFPDKVLGAPKTIHINTHLFDWVVENLLRNALDAMEGKGTIQAEIYDDHEFVYIDLSDTGKGIPSSKFKTVFRPGFTTKKRGWGLGLSLAKRIIEEYHSGKIFVKKSEVNRGTTFTIKLPKKKETALRRVEPEKVLSDSV